MSVYTSGNDELCCPLCGDTNTHVDGVALAARPSGEDGTVVEVSFDSRGTFTARDGLVPPSRIVGQGRRHRIALLGWCETCDGRFGLLFTQHKGVTLVESIDLASGERVLDEAS